MGKRGAAEVRRRKGAAGGRKKRDGEGPVPGSNEILGTKLQKCVRLCVCICGYAVCHLMLCVCCRLGHGM